MTGLIYFLFFCSGLSGLIYQVVWVRVFGNVFGNTIYSASLVIAVFMLGLGVGSYAVGTWADRRYAVELSLDRGAPTPTKRLARGDPDAPRRSPRASLLRTYGYFELLIAILGFGISVLLPHLDQLSSLVSFYSREASGWYSLSTLSYLARGAIALVLLTPITLLMGGTLTLLIRHLVRGDFEIGGWRIAVLYAVNTAGAALGCFLTDFALVPSWGLRGAQMAAVFFNAVAAVGAFYVASRARPVLLGSRPRASGSNLRGPQVAPSLSMVRRGSPSTLSLPNGSRGRPATAPEARRQKPEAYDQSLVVLTSLALVLSGFAAMGMEILWFRHVSILLGGFRAVFSLLLTVVLIGIGAGSLVGGLVHRRTNRPAEWLMAVQGLFIASTLIGLASVDGSRIDATVSAALARQNALGGATEAASGLTQTFAELWFNARPILLEVGIPALLMGFAFPLANAIVQRVERSVGHSAGVLYLSNTIGAVCGSLAAGFLLLPGFGIQGSATILTLIAGLAVVPLYFVQKGTVGQKEVVPLFRTASPFALSMLIGGVTLGLWVVLPSDYVIARALARPADQERLLTLSDGLNEVIAVTEVPGKGRTLLTNGHPMSSTRRLSQRYMRALAHIPLLSIDKPATVLVIGFGVGNTTHAATLHPTIRRVEVADLSRDILAHASYFKGANGDVLNDPRVIVYVNDGRHHLQMQPTSSYDLITLEPPPIGYAGVGALYSREFYALARTRLKPKGYISQWLPAYQVPTTTTLAMIRAFVDIFPQAVLISGAEADLLLLGANDSRIEVDPARLARALSNAPAVQADLQRLDLGSAREIVGAFVGSAAQLAEATRDSAPVSDDRPIQEYEVKSLLNFGQAVPASVVDLTRATAWCPKCFVEGKPVPLVEGLDTYFELLARAYAASALEIARIRNSADQETRVVAGSAYLGAILPETADLHNFLGIGLAEKGRLDEAIAEFREALRLEPESSLTHWHLGAALASRDAPEEAVEHLRRSVQLDPSNGQVRDDLASVHNNLGIALASQGRFDEAIDQFQQALAVHPEYADARRNLTQALRQRRPGA